MDRQKSGNRTGRRMTLLADIPVLIISAGLIMLLEMNLMPGGINTAWQTFTTQDHLLALNVLPVCATILILYLIIGNSFLSGALTTLIWGGLSYANLLKIDGRDDPLTPGDLGLIREAADAVSEYNLNMHWDKAILFILLFVLLLALGILFRGGRRSLKVCLPLALIIAAAFCLLVTKVYTDKTRYYSYEVETRYNVALEYNTLGFNYCFLYNYNLYPVDKPDNFSKPEYDALSASVVKNSPEIKPNIIFIMCEAFSDLADEDMFLYTEDASPLRDWHKVIERPNAVHGYIAVSNYAAGTANTEFNIMTGMQTNSIGTGLTSSFRVLHKDTVSIASVLKDDGYNTFFMHPGKSWFYNRQNVYRFFGIDDQVFEDAFGEKDYKGQFVSDEAFYNELTEDFRSRIEESDIPLFTYGVTIENHQAYRSYKFGWEPERAPLAVEVSAMAEENIAVYMEGVKDSSALILKLTEYVDGLNEPTILVFYGDHRPNLGDTYKELGLDYSEGGDISTYEVPFVIYANDNYLNILGGSLKYKEAFENIGIRTGITISDNYLGAAVLEFTGYGENDAYFEFLNEIRRSVPVYRLPSSLGNDEALGTDVSRRLHEWTYYRIKY